jgi:two-component system sensor histidine kinase DegS
MRPATHGGSPTTEPTLGDRERVRSREAAEAAAFRLHERERSRIAFDLHDGPAQAVSAALLQLRLIEEADGAEAADGREELKRLLTHALQEMYGLIDQLHSRALEHEGLAAKVRAQAEEFEARSGMPTALVVEGEEDGYSPSLQIAVFRIVSEALNNVRRHSGAASVDVHLVLARDSVNCSIEDDGCGFDVTTIPARVAGARGRFGLVGMRERAALLDGRCVVESAVGQGTRVEVVIPVWRRA